MYCGDGINDLTALGAADVGMAVGSSEASAAATLADRKSSIAGQPFQLRVSRGLVRRHEGSCEGSQGVL